MKTGSASRRGVVKQASVGHGWRISHYYLAVRIDRVKRSSFRRRWLATGPKK